MRIRAAAGFAAAGLLGGVVVAAYLAPDTKAPAPSPTSEPTNEASAADFIRTHAIASTSAADRFAWLLSDVVGAVILPEDERIPVAVLSSIGHPAVSAGARHLYYWTTEERGLRA